VTRHTIASSKLIGKLGAQACDGGTCVTPGAYFAKQCLSMVWPLIARPKVCFAQRLNPPLLRVCRYDWVYMVNPYSSVSLLHSDVYQALDEMLEASCSWGRYPISILTPQGRRNLVETQAWIALTLVVTVMSNISGFSFYEGRIAAGHLMTSLFVSLTFAASHGVDPEPCIWTQYWTTFAIYSWISLSIWNSPSPPCGIGSTEYWTHLFVLASTPPALILMLNRRRSAIPMMSFVTFFIAWLAMGEALAFRTPIPTVSSTNWTDQLV
jgi:hypothetical protein